MNPLTLIFIGIAVVLIFAARYFTVMSRVKDRLANIEISGDVRYQSSEDEDSFWERFMKPIADKFISKISSVIPVDEKSAEALSEKLKFAGIKQTAREYTAVSLILYTLSVLGVLVYTMLNRQIESTDSYLYIVIAVLSVYTLRRFILSKKITQRQEQIENEMPDILDLLSVSVCAGLGFDQALSYVTQRCNGVLVDELQIAIKDISLGRPRKDALKKLAGRCDVDALNNFVASVIQADTLGIPISNILKSQSQSIREYIRAKKEEAAAKLPVKILFPLVFCIFPVIFIVLLGPSVPSLMDLL